MTHDELSPMAQGYAVAMVESQQFWPEEFKPDLDIFELAEVDHFLPGANSSIEADCGRFMEMALGEIGHDTLLAESWTDDDLYRVGHNLWYRRLGRDTGFRTGETSLDLAMNIAAARLGRPTVSFCSIGYIRHSTKVEDWKLSW